MRKKRRQPESSRPHGTAQTTQPSTPLSSRPALYPPSSSLDTPSFHPRELSRRPISTHHVSSRPWHVPCSHLPRFRGKYSPSRPSYIRQSSGKAAALLVSPNDKRYSTNITAQFPSNASCEPPYKLYDEREIRCIDVLIERRLVTHKNARAQQFI